MLRGETQFQNDVDCHGKLINRVSHQPLTSKMPKATVWYNGIYHLCSIVYYYDYSL